MYDKTPEKRNAGKSTTSERLKEIMQETGYRQADIIKRAEPFFETIGTTLKRNDLSQYCSGVSVPRQGKLTLMSLALGVSEVWLMGYDVPREPDKKQTDLYYEIQGREPEESDEDKDNAFTIVRFFKLDTEDKKQVSKHINKLLRSEKYQ